MTWIVPAALSVAIVGFWLWMRPSGPGTTAMDVGLSIRAGIYGLILIAAIWALWALVLWAS